LRVIGLPTGIPRCAVRHTSRPRQYGVSAEDIAAILRCQDRPRGTIEDINETPQNAVGSPLKPAAPR